MTPSGHPSQLCLSVYLYGDFSSRGSIVHQMLPEDLKLNNLRSESLLPTALSLSTGRLKSARWASSVLWPMMNAVLQGWEGVKRVSSDTALESWYVLPVGRLWENINLSDSTKAWPICTCELTTLSLPFMLCVVIEPAFCHPASIST